MVLDFVGVTDRETGRFIEAARRGRLGDDVPSCPGWSVADLVAHLLEVQTFWATIVEGRLDDPAEVPDMSRPPDTELVGAMDAARRRLVRALGDAEPDEACWTWAAHDRSVGFVVRRQAHEALIHRVDAELGAGSAVTAIEPELAADGVSELLDSYMTHLPDWATFTRDGQGVHLAATDFDRRWKLAFGRFSGTSPVSGNTYDFDSAIVDDEAPSTLRLSGAAADLDRWLWGRGAVDGLAVDGDASLVGRLRAIAAEDTS